MRPTVFNFIYHMTSMYKRRLNKDISSSINTYISKIKKEFKEENKEKYSNINLQGKNLLI